jgi:hypothetical protein
MYLAPTEDQLEIVEATRDVLLGEAPFERWFVPNMDAAADYARLSELGVSMGWTGFAAPGDIGGSEATELGARLAPVGLAATAVAARVAAAAGKGEFAAALVGGENSASLVAGEHGDVLLGTGGIGLALEGATLRLLDVSQAVATGLSFDWSTPAAKMSGAPVLAEIEDAQLSRELRLLVAAQAQGVAESALAQANGYAKERQQFGRAIGSFQAISHRLADMEAITRRAETQLRFAAVRNQDGASDAELQCVSALLLAVKAARIASEANIFIHGAMGVTTENIGHLLLKRALLWQLVAGSEIALLDAVAQCDAPQL